MAERRRFNQPFAKRRLNFSVFEGSELKISARPV